MEWERTAPPHCVHWSVKHENWCTATPTYTLRDPFDYDNLIYVCDHHMHKTLCKPRRHIPNDDEYTEYVTLSCASWSVMPIENTTQ